MSINLLIFLWILGAWALAPLIAWTGDRLDEKMKKWYRYHRKGRGKCGRKRGAFNE